jgi:hypothetical protein
MSSDTEAARCRDCAEQAEAACEACAAPVCRAHRDASWCAACERAFDGFRQRDGRRRWRRFIGYCLATTCVVMSASTGLHGVIVTVGCMGGLLLVAAPKRDLRRRFIAGGVPRAALRGAPQSTP